MAKRKRQEEIKEKIRHGLKKEDGSGILVPAGLLIGLGFGFLYNKIPAGLFIGLGVGLLLMAIIKLVRGR